MLLILRSLIVVDGNHRTALIQRAKRERWETKVPLPTHVPMLILRCDIPLLVYRSLVKVAEEIKEGMF